MGDPSSTRPSRHTDVLVTRFKSALDRLVGMLQEAGGQEVPVKGKASRQCRQGHSLRQGCKAAREAVEKLQRLQTLEGVG